MRSERYSLVSLSAPFMLYFYHVESMDDVKDQLHISMGMSCAQETGNCVKNINESFVFYTFSVITSFVNLAIVAKH